MLAQIKRLFSRYGFHRQPVHQRSGSSVGPVVSSDDIWWEHKFHTEQQRKTERLAAIAAEIVALNAKRLKAKEQKKNQTVYENQMKALMNERLAIEQGKEWVK